MLETFTVEMFAPHVGDKFQFFYNTSDALDLELISAKELGTESAKEWNKVSGRAPFTLIFLGPSDRVLSQGICRVKHDGMDPFEIFVVPIGPNQEGMQYEVIFT